MTVEEALSEIRGIVLERESQDGWYSMRELVAASRASGECRSNYWLGEKLRALHAAGRVEVRKLPRLRITGDYFPTACYRVLP